MWARYNALNLIFIWSLGVISIQSSPFGNTRIYGGEEVKRGQFPYHATLRTHDGITGLFTFHLCGGSILSEIFVLTAAHCIGSPEVFDPIMFRVFVGESTTYDGKEYKLMAFIQHEKYDETTYANDVGLIQLKDSIEFSPLIAPVQLGRELIDTKVRAVFIGSGMNRIHKPDYILKYLYLDTMSNEDCRAQFKGFGLPPIHDFTNSCAYSEEKGKGSCQVDSGGPLVYNNTVIGVLCWTTLPCAIGYPDGFMRVSEYVDWIEKNMQLAM